MDALKSRKLWLTVLGVMGVNVAGLEGLPWYVIAAIALIIAAYSIGQGIADQGKESAKIISAPIKVTDADKVIAVPSAAPPVIESAEIDRSAPTVPPTKEE